MSQDKKRGKCCRRLIKMGLFFRRCLPIFLLIVYSFGGGALFYHLENGGICSYDFWASVWFVNTVLTTIGYGRTHPCTTAGKIFTCLYAVLGIPLTVVAFAAVGDLLISPLNFVWKKIPSCKRCRKGHDPDEDSVEVPLGLGLFITVVWIGLSALYFYFMSERTDKQWHPTSHWYYLDALYFVFVSITTIGFGDYIPTDYVFGASHFACIIVGLSLFTMCIGLVQEKIRQFILSVKREIYRLYKKALLTGADMSDADVKQLIKGMKGGRFLSLLMSRRTLTNLQLELDMLTKRTSKEVQTSPETNMNSATSQTPKAINKITEKNVVHMATQTTKYFRVNADWHKETEDLDQIMF